MALPVTIPKIHPELLDTRRRTFRREIYRCGFTVDILRSRGTLTRDRHPCIEMILVHSGTVVLSVGKWIEVLVPGDVVVFDGNMVHGVRPVQKGYVRTLMHIWPELVGSSLRPSLPTGRQAPWKVSLREPAFHWVFQVSCLLRSYLNGYPVAKHSGELLTGLLGEIRNELLGSGRASAHPVIGNVVDFMKQSPNQTGRVGDLPQRFFTSQGHLCRLFQAHFGCSPQYLWQLITIERLCSALPWTFQSVTEVGGNAGFASRSGFQRAFRRVTGMSVSAYQDHALTKCGLQPLH